MLVVAWVLRHPLLLLLPLHLFEQHMQCFISQLRAGCMCNWVD